MEPDNWTAIEAAIDEFKTAISFGNVPGDHPRTLAKLERLMEVVAKVDVPKDKCSQLLRAARKCYADRGRRSRSVSEVNNDHRSMLENLASVQARVEMLKALRR